jgi:hypothetical protein
VNTLKFWSLILKMKEKASKTGDSPPRKALWKGDGLCEYAQILEPHSEDEGKGIQNGGLSATKSTIEAGWPLRITSKLTGSKGSNYHTF